LTADEMKAIVGAQRGPDGFSFEPEGGPALPWQGQAGDVKTTNGNKVTTIPIVAWTAKGGLPVSLSVFHNSVVTFNTELGQHWSHSYRIRLDLDSSSNARVRWGNELYYNFTRNMDGSYTPDFGIHDTFASVGSTSYVLTTKDQVKY